MCAYSAFPPTVSCLLSLEVAMVRSININGVNQVYIDHPEVNAAAIIYSEMGCYAQCGIVFIPFIQATLFNLLVFVLSVVGLSSERFECPLKRRLRTQGILYFAVAGIVYIPPVVSPYSPPPTGFSIIFRLLLSLVTAVRLNFFRCCPDSIAIQLYLFSFPILVSRKLRWCTRRG